MSHSMQEERRSWAILALVGVAQFMVVLDITIVNVALPSIGAALDFAPSDLQWVVTAYVLFSGGLLLVGGRAADLFGRRRMFGLGLAVFTTASLLSGLAPSAASLVAARAVQGIGAAMLTPAALSIVTTTYAGAQRAVALSIWGAIASAGVAAGVLFGGMLTTWLSWEWVFLVNVPVGAIALALTPRLVSPAHPASGRDSLDLAGALAVVGGLATLVYALSRAPEDGWGSLSTLGFLALSAGLLGAFLALERRARRPLVPSRVWRIGSLVSGAGVMLGVTGLMAGSFFLNSLYLQRVLGWSALETGLGFLPFVLAIMVGVHGTSHVIGRVGSRVVIVGGLTLVSAGLLLLALAPDRAAYAPDLLPGFALLGVGVGLTFPAVSITAMNDVDHDGAGLASGLMMTAHEVGAALGIAVLSAIVAGAAPAAGYEDALLAATAIAGLLGAGAAISVPSVRPAAGAHVGMH